jgi:hypothetical protein
MFPFIFGNINPYKHLSFILNPWVLLFEFFLLLSLWETFFFR